MTNSFGRHAKPTLGIVMPVFDEATQVSQCLAELLRSSAFHEIIVVDGGSEDATCSIVSQFVDKSADLDKSDIRLLASSCGRARQMNMGASQARSDVLLFLHADTRLPPGTVERVQTAINSGYLWGRFDVRLDDDHILFRVVERLMNVRSALSGIATGDQAVFVRRDVFEMLGGYAPIALMEDIELCKRLKWVGPPARIQDKVTTSTRRWRHFGITRTVVLMWWLRLLYWFGVSPDRLVCFYKNSR